MSVAVNVSRKVFLVGLTTVIVLTRLPLLLSGYGSDGDAWRVAHVGHTLWTSGVYEMSRPPGYPAHEILSAPLVALGGSVLSNAVTLIASIVAVFVWHAFVHGRTQRPGMLTVAFAFTPLFWVNSATTMDYIWSLLMILLAMHAIMRTKSISAGVWAGLAIGFRPTNAVLLVPLAILLVTVMRRSGVSCHCERSPGGASEAISPMNDHKERLLRTEERARKDAGPVDGLSRNDEARRSLLPLLIFLVFSCVTVVVVFLPVVFTYGIGGWLGELRSQVGSSAIGLNEAPLYFVYRTIYAIGPLAFLSMLWIVLRKGAFSTAWNSRNHLFAISLAALCVLLVFFALFPLEKSYLLAGLPFLLLVLDRLATPRAFSLFTLFIISYAFVNPDCIQHGGARGTPRFNVHTGMVIEEWQKRKELEEWRNQLASVAVPERTVIMTGVGPAFWFENDAVEAVQHPIVRNVNDVVVRRKGNPSILFVPMIPREETERLQHLGWRVMCDTTNQQYIERTMGYRIDTLTGIPLPILPSPHSPDNSPPH